MKKSQLRKIIRESIKELIKEQSGPWTHYHIYEGCQGTIANGVGSTAGPSIPTCITTGTCGLSGFISGDNLHNNNLIHIAWGSPQIGNIIKFYTCNPNAENCHPSCMKYIGTCEFGSGNCGQYQPLPFGGSSNPGQTVGHFSTCEDCDRDETDYTPGCNEIEACNYNPNATNFGPTNYVACFYPDECEECKPNALALSDSFSPSYNPYSAQFSNITVQPSSACGCTDAGALNYDPPATIDDGSCNYGYKCESVWFIQTGRRDKNIGNQCIPGTSQNPGTFGSMQLCQNGCKETRVPNITKKDITPFTTDPQSKKSDSTPTKPNPTPIDPEVDRMQQLAGIREDVSFPVWRRCTTKPGCSGGTRDGGCDEGTKCKKDSDCGWNTCCKCKTYYKNPTGKEAPPDGYERKRR